jgi:hypothetical protein
MRRRCRRVRGRSAWRSWSKPGGAGVNLLRHEQGLAGIIGVFDFGAFGEAADVDRPALGVEGAAYEAGAAFDGRALGGHHAAFGVGRWLGIGALEGHLFDLIAEDTGGVFVVESGDDFPAVLTLHRLHEATEPIDEAERLPGAGLGTLEFVEVGDGQFFGLRNFGAGGEQAIANAHQRSLGGAGDFVNLRGVGGIGRVGEGEAKFSGGPGREIDGAGGRLGCFRGAGGEAAEGENGEDDFHRARRFFPRAACGEVSVMARELG